MYSSGQSQGWYHMLLLYCRTQIKTTLNAFISVRVSKYGLLQHTECYMPFNKLVNL